MTKGQLDKALSVIEDDCWVAGLRIRLEDLRDTASNSANIEHVSVPTTFFELYYTSKSIIAITSYHEIEAELDAKTLVYRAGADRRRLVACATPNPFSSQLPHLDELFPGRTYAANAFLSVYAGSGG